MNRAVFFGVIASLSAGANAEVVTFSGIPSGDSPTAQPTYVEDGITVTSLDGNFWGYPNPGELHLDPEGFGNKFFDFEYAGGAFDLVSFDITFGTIGSVAYLTGYDENGLLLNSLSVSGFGTIDITGFDGIYTLRIGNYGDHFSIDNVTVTTAIPEPGTWLTALIGFGLAGAALRRRRKQSANLQLA